MNIKVDCKILDEQIKMLDIYASLIRDDHKREMIDGVINLLDKICWALEEGEEIYLEKIEEK